MEIVRYVLGIPFVIAAGYAAIRGITYRFLDTANKETHKRRALYLTAALASGVIAFELYYPTVAVLICIPIALAGIWLNYLVAVAQINHLLKK